MPLYMDVHKLPPDVTPLMVEKAHEADVSIQDEYRVRYRGYWYNADTHTVVCLAEGPDAEACDAVHKHAHGLQADSIIEVPPDAVDAFLGGGMVSLGGEVLRSDGARDTGLRVMVVSELDDLAEVSGSHGDAAAVELADRHERIVREAAMANDGRVAQNWGDGMMLSFLSASAAVRCALAIQKECARVAREEEMAPAVRVGIAAGEPVSRQEGLFGVVVDQARGLCRSATPGQILTTPGVRELCAGKGLAFSGATNVRPPGSKRALQAVLVREGPGEAVAVAPPAEGSDVLRHMNEALAPRYAIQRELGQGGMATVYVARDERHEREVAMKVFRAGLAEALGTERFLKEIRVAARLTHPNIVPLFDSGEAAGRLYYVMPHLEGESLRAMIRRERQLPVEHAIRVACNLAGALDYAHRHGVVHRDIKPENILMLEGQPMVLDFGIALALTEAGGDRLTQTGLAVGTPAYMSPEQAAGDQEMDGRADVYALGCVLYEMLIGEPPFAAPNVRAVFAKILTESPRPVREIRPVVPPEVEEAVARALAKRPSERFESAAEFAGALEAVTRREVPVL